MEYMEWLISFVSKPSFVGRLRKRYIFKNFTFGGMWRKKALLNQLQPSQLFEKQKLRNKQGHIYKVEIKKQFN